MKALLLFFIFFLATTLQAKRIRDIDFKIDTTNFGITNTYSVTVFLIKRSGKRITLSPRQLSLKWGSISVTAPHVLSFRNGIITFDQLAINNENNKVSLEVSYKKREHVVQANITYPYVTSIAIQNNDISVNHPTIIQYELEFSNGKKAIQNESLFNSSNLETTSSTSDFQLNKSQMMLLLNEPASYETVKLSCRNKRSNLLLSEKILTIAYLTNTTIEAQGANGSNGANGNDGRKISENGSSGGSGQNGFNGNDVRVFAKTRTVNGKKYVILQLFSSTGKHQTEIMWYDGRPILINANGGKGGNGGAGGNGIKGLIDKTKSINLPLGGNGGNGGRSGNGGDGGRIFFVIENSSEDIKNYFSTTSSGGGYGRAGNSGEGGKGDYSDLVSNGKIQTSRDGKQGTNGSQGTTGRNGAIMHPLMVASEEWENQYNKHVSEGFIK